MIGFFSRPRFVFQILFVLGVRIFGHVDFLVITIECVLLRLNAIERGKKEACNCLVVFGERILLVGIVVDTTPVREFGRVGARRIREADPMPLANAVSQLRLRVFVQLGLLGRYERWLT